MPVASGERLLCCMLACLLTLLPGPVLAALRIGPDAAPVTPQVHYKAFSDSWVVLLSAHGGLLFTDLLVPQLCRRGAACSALDAEAEIGDCSRLDARLGEAGWENQNAGPGTLCAALADPEQTQRLQRSAQDVCASPCAHVLQPLGLEVLGAGEALLEPYDRGGGNTTHLLARIVAVTVLAREAAPVLALSVHSFELTLRRPGLVAATVGLEHECARRGLRAPPLSTMDLFLADSGAFVCNWNCRPDHVRAQWNLEPLERNATPGGGVLHICWPFPRNFVAVFFTMHIGSTVRAPHAALLPASFYSDVNALADNIQTESFPTGMVLLNVPSSNFDNARFVDVVAAAAASMRGSYEVLELGNLPTSEQRRLLALGSTTGTLQAEGVAINPRSTLAPQAYARQASAALELARNRLPPSIADIGSVQLLSLHRVSAPFASNGSSAPERGRAPGAAGLGAELVLGVAVAALAFIALLGRKKHWRQREAAWRRLDEQ